MKGNIPAEVLVRTETNGKMHPFRIRLTDESGEYQVININNIVISDVVKSITGGKNIKYICSIILNDCTREVELIYNTDNQKWFLKL